MARGSCGQPEGGADDASAPSDGPDLVDEAGGDVDPSAPWYVFLARRCCLLSARLEDMLFATQLTSLYAAWASVPWPDLRGVAFLDCAWIYLRGQRPTMRLATPEERRFIYLCVPHRLLSMPREVGGRESSHNPTLEVMRALGGGNSPAVEGPAVETGADSVVVRAGAVIPAEGATAVESAPAAALECVLNDPYLQSAMARVQRYYEESFWDNAEGIRAHMAGVALAKRGVNVPQFFFLLGPGGVGISLSTVHLEAMLGTLTHRYLDPQALFLDEEARKQMEQLRGARVVTAQERPEGMKGKLRVDVFKKIATAEGVFTRLPYAPKTDRVCIVGLKRMELNSPLMFPHVSERCFDSVFRRCCVIRMKSCFVDHRTHREQVTDAMKEGIFVREYDLADFLRSGPGALAGIIAQHGFEAEHSRDECVDLIAHYVERGGDGGTTWNTMRASCGLPPKRPPWEAPLRPRKHRPGATAAEAVAVPAGAAPADAPRGAADDRGLHGVVGMAIARRVGAPATEVKVEQAGTQGPGTMKAEDGAVGHGVPSITPEYTQSAVLMSIHIARTADRDFFSISAFKLAVWPGLPSNRTFRQSLFSSMLASGLLIKAQGRSTSAADAYYFPRLETGEAFDSLVSREFRDSRVSVGVTLRENLDVERFADWFNAPGRSSNASVLASTLRANVPKRKQGRADLTTPPGDGDEFAERADRILQAESSFRRLLQVLTPAGAPPPPKRRRGESPSPQPANARMSQEVRYTANLGGGRVWARSVGAQGLPRRAACELLHRTVDLDIVACVFVLVHQMVRRLALRPAAAFEDEMAVLGLLATRRDALIAEELECDLASGKALLIAVLGGQTIPARWQGNAFLARVRSAGRMLRWLACSCVPDVYSRAASDEAKWAMGSTFAIWWQILEDRMLAAWVAHIASTRVLCDHLSLHHDGVRVDAAAVASMGGGSIEAFCEASAMAIERETGFMVAIVEKKHRSFLDSLRERSAGRTPAPASTPLLLRNGNCIPLALSRHRDAIGAAAAPVWSDAFLNAEVAMSSGLRRYKECFTKARLSCDQHLGFDPRGSGAYLLHCEHRGRPHCVAVRVDEAVQQATVFDAELAWEVPVAELR